MITQDFKINRIMNFLIEIKINRYDNKILRIKSIRKYRRY